MPYKKYEITCGGCGKQCVIKRSDKQAIPRFCSNACKGASYAVTRRGEGNPMHGHTGELCPLFGKKHSDETKLKQSLAKKGRKFPNISKAQQGKKAF